MRRGEQILRVLNAPKFVYRYFENEKTIPELQAKVECRVLVEKYSEYLSNYNTFALFQWKSTENLKFTSDYFWKDFAHKVSSLTQKAIFLEDKVHREALNCSLQIPVRSLGDDTEYYCTFQDVFEPRHIDHMIQLTAEPDVKLQLHTLGLNTGSNSIAAYIQTLLEETESMYKDLSYEKLLSIARKSRSGEDRPIKDLLNSLADKGITNSRMAQGGQWLTLSKQ